MAITPRTILMQPLNLLLFAFAILALGGVLGILAGVSNSEHRPAAPYGSPDDQASLDTGVAAASDGEAAGLGEEGDLQFERLDLTCQLEEPAPGWSEGQWIRHLGCMEARGETAEVLVAETTAAIDAVGMTPDLAVTKADHLEVAGTPNAHIDFLDTAVNRLGVSDGRLVHRLAQALTWRGEAGDIERIRHLQLLSRMLLPDSCEVLQTDIWVRYALAKQVAEEPSPAAWHGVSHAVDTYVTDDCHLRADLGRADLGSADLGRADLGRADLDQQESDQRDILIEMVGVGVVAEATNGHTGQSTLIRQAAEASELRGQISEVRSFCREAVPGGVGLRDECEKRLGDELFLAR